MAKRPHATDSPPPPPPPLRNDPFTHGILTSWHTRRTHVRLCLVPHPKPDPQPVYQGLVLAERRIRREALGETRVLRLVAAFLAEACSVQRPRDGRHTTDAPLRTCQLCHGAACASCLVEDLCSQCDLTLVQCRDCAVDFVYTCSACHTVEPRLCAVCVNERDQLVGHHPSLNRGPRHLLLCRCCQHDRCMCKGCGLTVCPVCEPDTLALTPLSSALLCRVCIRSLTVVRFEHPTPQQ